MDIFYVFSQLFALSTLVCAVIAYQCSKKSVLLIWFSLANFLLTISYIFLADWVGAVLLGVATARCVSFFFLEKWRNKIASWVSLSCLIFFLILHCISTALTWTMWFDFLLLAGVIFVTTCTWRDGNFWVRIANMTYSTMLIVHNIMVSNWTAIAVESSVIISVMIYFLRTNKKTKLVPALKENETLNEAEILITEDIKQIKEVPKTDDFKQADQAVFLSVAGTE